MNTLPEEILLLICKDISGDDCLSLACTSPEVHNKMKAESFVSKLSLGYPFLFVDLPYYAYCYSQYYLERRKIRNDTTFVDVARRTFRDGRMTSHGIATLRSWLDELKEKLKQSTNHPRPLPRGLRSIYYLTRTHAPEIAQEIHDFATDIGQLPSVVLPLRSGATFDLERIKSDDVVWFRENKVSKSLVFCSFNQACRYNSHGLMLLFLEQHESFMFSRAYPYCQLYNNFLHPNLDARSMEIIFEFFGAVMPLFPTIEYLLAWDNLPAFTVVYNRYKDPMMSNPIVFGESCKKLCLVYDAVRCLRSLDVPVSRDEFTGAAYKVRRYYHR